MSQNWERKGVARRKERRGIKKGASAPNTPEAETLLQGYAADPIVAGVGDIHALGGTGRSSWKHGHSAGKGDTGLRRLAVVAQSGVAATCHRADFPGPSGNLPDTAVAGVSDKHVARALRHAVFLQAMGRREEEEVWQTAGWPNL